MSRLFDDFIEQDEQLQEAPESQQDPIVVTPGSDIAVDNKEQPKPMSALKLQRMKEKEKKEQRLAEKKINTVRKKQHEHQKKEQKQHQRKGFDMKGAKWSEAKSTAMDVTRLLGGYENIAMQAASILTNPGIELTDEGRDMINSRVTVITRDIQNFKDKWQVICEPMSGKEGKVLLDEFPAFYLIYEDLLQLHEEINNVLIDQADMLSEFVNVVIKKANEFDNEHGLAQEKEEVKQDEPK